MNELNFFFYFGFLDRLELGDEAIPMEKYWNKPSLHYIILSCGHVNTLTVILMSEQLKRFCRGQKQWNLCHDINTAKSSISYEHQFYSRVWPLLYNKTFFPTILPCFIFIYINLHNHELSQHKRADLNPKWPLSSSQIQIAYLGHYKANYKVNYSYSTYFFSEKAKQYIMFFIMLWYCKIMGKGHTLKYWILKKKKT